MRAALTILLMSIGLAFLLAGAMLSPGLVPREKLKTLDDEWRELVKART